MVKQVTDEERIEWAYELSDWSTMRKRLGALCRQYEADHERGSMELDAEASYLADLFAAVIRRCKHHADRRGR